MVRDLREPVAADGVLEAWRSETGGRYRLESTSSAGEENGDLLIMPSVADAWRLAEADELRPVYSDAIAGTIPAVLHDPESRWVALSTRARVVVYNPTLVDRAELDSLTGYSSLADAAWQGRLCLSSSSVAGNRLLVAFLLESLPVRDAEIVVRKWLANLTGPVYVDDASLVTAVAAGTCAIGIADSSLVVASGSAASVAMHWFGSTADTLVDATVAGVSRHAASADVATALLEWLVTATPNSLFAIQALEFPANPAGVPAEPLTPGATYARGDVSLGRLGFLLEEAARLIERARYP